MATLREYFIKDFSQFLNAAQDHKAMDIRVGKEHSYPVRMHFDFDSCAKFLSIYIPSGLNPATLMKIYLRDISQALKVADGVEVQQGFGGYEEYTSSTELVFTGRVFVYAEEDIEKTAIDNLTQIARERSIKLLIRGPRYVAERNRFEKPAAFICHDSRDKEDVAERIAVGLQKLMCPVWYDEHSLKVGDSLRESIENGIKISRTCVLILSPNFIFNDGWTKAEFDSIYTREIIEKNNVMLPVWHNVSKEQVYQYSPRLADRVAANTKDGIEEVVRKLHTAIASKT